MPYLAHPLALLLLLPLAWRLWTWGRRRQGALRYSSLSLVRFLPAGRSRQARRGGLILRGAALFCLVIACAGLRWPDPGSRVPTEGVSIAFVLDASESMRNADFLDDGKVLTRWQAVQKTARLFIRGGEVGGQIFPGRPNDLIALVTFARRPETDCPLTLDHEAILSIIDEEEPRRLQGTNPGDALAWALHFLANAPTRRKAIIFLSDGEDNVRENNLSPAQAAEIAAALKVPIYAVEAEPLPDESLPDEGKEARANMQMLAKTSGGEFYSAKDTAGLLRAYAAIDQMERDRIETYQYRRYLDLDGWLAGVAVGVFLLLAFLEATWWRRTP
ncbi:MAG: VWA domain-containing protein [Gemmataceae bacterium]